ncbi:MAG: hypothetical protein JEZ05_08230 [Tenericutes bacterium]|nr:hypothetical protein [Mycoplasmatota bacterium]
MTSKVDFLRYLSNKHITDSFERFSPEFKDHIEDVYNNHSISLAPYLSSNKTEEQIFMLINNEIKDNYIAKGHDVGVGISKKYYMKENVPLYMKVLHYYISQAYSSNNNKIDKITHLYIKKDRTSWYASNSTVAIAIGILAEDELDPAVIDKARRKITDQLEILKNYYKVIQVTQTYRPGLKGSGHKVTLDFNKLIQLFNHYDVNEEGSIRFRKTIRYRVISFIRTVGESVKGALKKLIEKQKNSYLLGLVSFNVEEFRNNKYVLFKYMKNLKWLGIPKDMYLTKNIVPVFNKDQTELTLKIKNEILIPEFNNASKYLISDFKKKFNINLTVVASC